MTDKNWGGARPGSGRKADPEGKRVQMVVTVDRKTRDTLKRVAEDRGIRVGRLLDQVAKDLDGWNPIW